MKLASELLLDAFFKRYGWWRNPGPGQRNWSYAGWLLQRVLSPRVTLGGELFRNTATSTQDRAASGCDLGAVANFGEKYHLLVSAGRTLSGDRETFACLGWQLTVAAARGVPAWFGR
ncbi:MAG: hypothetical protein ABSH53_05835 [Holophaga sp.]|jgi:hypothetical protein